LARSLSPYPAFLKPATSFCSRRVADCVAAVVELFSRRVVGWAMKAERTAQLVTDALIMAI
jgi:transposase InsO family protein